MTLKEARKITGGLEAWGTADPKKFYKNVQKELEDLFYADRIIYTWKNMGRYAMGMYDTPQEAMDILVANSNRPFKSGDVKRFYLVKYMNGSFDTFFWTYCFVNWFYVSALFAFVIFYIKKKLN